MMPRRTIAQLVARGRPAVDPEARAAAEAIIADVERRGETAVMDHARRLGDLRAGEQPYITREHLRRCLASLPAPERLVLERTASRIRRFAEAQRASLADLAITVPGGTAGHTIVPVERAGCYAPGGRYPLPSSALMTTITARAAGVSAVWLASPRPDARTMAAAALADADGVIAVGGAQAIAALTFGCGPVPAMDLIVGPGNHYVTAAKHLVSDRTGIDMLAGPTELVVVADASADATRIARELLAQAEHDPDAVVVLITTCAALANAVDRELTGQLERLPTALVARAALSHGATLVVPDMEEALAVCDTLAPEHLSLQGVLAEALAPRVRHCGALFSGCATSVALGDYGAGPNHVLPTGGTARRTGGLSVLTFLRIRTWLRIEDAETARELCSDAAQLARMEGLEAHAVRCEM